MSTPYTAAHEQAVLRLQRLMLGLGLLGYPKATYTSGTAQVPAEQPVTITWGDWSWSGTVANAVARIDRDRPTTRDDLILCLEATS